MDIRGFQLNNFVFKRGLNLETIRSKFTTTTSLPGKVIIEKSCGEVSLMGQETIENVSLFFFKFHTFLMHQNVPHFIETFLRYMMVS